LIASGARPAAGTAQARERRSRKPPRAPDPAHGGRASEAEAALRKGAVK